MPRKKELSAEDQELRIRLGAAIRVASGQKSLRPADLAAATGVSLAHQYRIEGGEQTADFLYLVKVATLLGMSIDGLLQRAQAGVTLTPPQQVSIRGSRNVTATGAGAQAAGRDINNGKARKP